MAEPSHTSTDSFRLRAQRSDLRRAWLMAGAFGVFFAIAEVRRALGGAVMTEARVFFPTVVALGLGVVVQLALIARLRRLNREGRAAPRWQDWATAAADTLVPCVCLFFAHLYSPRGAYAALSGPTLMLLPLVTLLSVLRLRPRFPLAIGGASALFHWSLAVSTIYGANLESQLYPVLFTYGLALGLIGIAGGLVSAEAKRYVVEGLAEQEAAHRAQQKLSLLDHDLSMARGIQRGLLPSAPPVLPGFDIAGMNRPSEQVGGDYYDWQVVPDGRVAVALADVTGHGIGPALVMAVCRAYSRASAVQTPRPADLLQRINTLIQPDLSMGRFITMVIALIGPDGLVRMSSAGHGPTLLYRAASGQIENFGGDALPLGIDADEQYVVDRELRLAKGDVLLMLTDGYIEWTGPDRTQFGMKRVSEALAAAAGGDAKSIIEAIDAAIHRFVGEAEQDDDMTLVAVKRL